jgi:hypothetical protein
MAIAENAHDHPAEGKDAEVETGNGVTQMQVAADERHERTEHRLEKREIAQQPVGRSGEAIALKVWACTQGVFTPA